MASALQTPKIQEEKITAIIDEAQNVIQSSSSKRVLSTYSALQLQQTTLIIC